MLCLIPFVAQLVHDVSSPFSLFVHMLQTTTTRVATSPPHDIPPPPPLSSSPTLFSFPSNFVLGTATSSYQIEGGRESRGVSIWDTFCETSTNSQQQHHIWNDSNANVACDHYHRFRQDVQLLHDLGIPHYRFSISWPRILPNGTATTTSSSSGDSSINAQGVDFYNQLIDTLLEYNITPWITLYHWDLPQALQDQYGGWLGRETVDAFGEYARLCFQAFGDRVHHWITINEAWSVAVLGYNNGVHAPGYSSHPTTEPYLVGHHLLLAHATAAHIYQTEFEKPHHQHGGHIGMSNCGDYRYPSNPDLIQDQEAAERAMLFQMGWFTDPLVFGDYPSEMRRMLGDRLPQFTTAEQELLLSLSSSSSSSTT
jgi:beta-glucosidase/6-phospho-beta-glucosidase/beta-galactosidase